MSTIQDLLDLVEDVLEECRTNFPSDDLEVTDYTTFRLETCSRCLSLNISSLTIQTPRCSYLPLLRDFHRCINDLQHVWQVNLARLEGRSPMLQEGRPRKLINLELVRQYYIANETVSPTLPPHPTAKSKCVIGMQ